MIDLTEVRHEYTMSDDRKVVHLTIDADERQRVVQELIQASWDNRCVDIMLDESTLLHRPVVMNYRKVLLKSCFDLVARSNSWIINL